MPKQPGLGGARFRRAAG